MRSGSAPGREDDDDEDDDVTARRWWWGEDVGGILDALVQRAAEARAAGDADLLLMGCAARGAPDIDAALAGATEEERAALYAALLDAHVEAHADDLERELEEAYEEALDADEDLAAVAAREEAAERVVDERREWGRP